MVKIHYDSINDCMFELSYKLDDYITNDIFWKFPQHTELYFLFELFKQDSRFAFGGQFSLIWSTQFQWNLNEDIFIIDLDEDYDAILYFVQNPEKREIVAEYIRDLVESKCKSKHE